MQSSAVVGRPKSLKKRQAILQAAKELFLQFGYEGSSMDAIAKEAGVSKLTVYNHFKDKVSLFVAAIEMVSEQRLPKSYYQLAEEDALDTVLCRLGVALMSMLYSSEAIKMTLLMFSLAGTNQELVDMFYQAGPAKTRANMSQLMQTIQQQQKLNIVDATESAELFLSINADAYYYDVLWGARPVPSLAEIEHNVRRRVALFIATHRGLAEQTHC